MAMFRKAAEFLGLVDDDGVDDYTLDDGYLDEGDAGYADEGYGGYDETPRRDVPRGRDSEPARERASRAAERTDPGSGSVTVVRGRGENSSVTPVVAVVPRPASLDTPAVRPVPATAPNVHVLEPRSFNDAQEIGDRVKAGQPVIMNLQGNDRELQRRLIDFASGLCYGLGGTMSKAADQVFLLTPANVDVSDAEVERLSARGLHRHH